MRDRRVVVNRRMPRGGGASSRGTPQHAGGAATQAPRASAAQIARHPKTHRGPLQQCASGPLAALEPGGVTPYKFVLLTAVLGFSVSCVVGDPPDPVRTPGDADGDGISDDDEGRDDERNTDGTECAD